MASKFENKDGTLTAYAFACGYVQRKGEYKLFEDGCFHVQGLGIWQTFSTLTEARKALNAFARHVHEWETAYDNSERVTGAYCLVPNCSLFVGANDFVGAR
jgi:hypothetical protein